MHENLLPAGHAAASLPSTTVALSQHAAHSIADAPLTLTPAGEPV